MLLHFAALPPPQYMENYNATMQSKDKADRIAGNVAAVKNEAKRR